MKAIKKQAPLFYVTLLFTFLGGLIVGVYIIKPQFPPYKRDLILQSFLSLDRYKKKELQTREAVDENIINRYYLLDPTYQNIPVDNLITLRTKDQINRKRQKLIETIWGKTSLPLNILPNLVESDIKQFTHFENLQQVDKYSVSMDHGLLSVIYIFHPQEKNKNGVIYHEGHQGSIRQGAIAIKNLIYYGYTVAVLSMPLLGDNNQPIVNIANLGPLKLQLHDQFKFLDHPIRFFMEPVVATVNFFEKNNPQQSIFMIGPGGGGWTTTVYSAIDPRITKSYPVSGSYPFYLRSGDKFDWGDFEETYPPLLEAADYLDLYVLGAYGEKRNQLQVIARYNQCCYGGLKYKTYEQRVKEAVQNLGEGRFDIFVDEENINESISSSAMTAILRDMVQ